MNTAYYYDDSDLYDAMYADVRADVPLFVQLAKQAGGPVLEVCCGNGRVLLPMLAAGVRADGLDLSPELLAGLREKLAARGWAAGLHCSDMAEFELSQRYAQVAITFNSFLHNLTQERQIATLRCCRAHLEPGGSLRMAAFHPALDKLLSSAEGEILVKDIPDAAGNGRVRVTDRTRDDHVEQIRDVTRRVDFLDASGALTRTKSMRFLLRYIFKPEMELLLCTAGFGRFEAQPLESGGDGIWQPAPREIREGDMLLWTAWNE